MLLGLPLVANAATGQEHGALLSGHGCGRATGYAETNKIVTAEGRTHVAWLDSVPEGFRVRIRTVTHATGQWSPTTTVGEAFDNHGGPALAMDGRGFLHVVYYPHHHAFRYRRSVRANDSSAWTEAEEVGVRCTYPTLVVDADDGLLLSARVSKEQQPWEVVLLHRPRDGDWQQRAVLLRSRQQGYSHFQEALAFSPDHRCLHLSCRVYEGPKGAVQTVGAARSLDGGQSWQRADGTKAELPMTAEDLDVLARGGAAARPLRCGSIAVNAAGQPHVLFSSTEGGRGELHVSVEREETWTTTSLRERTKGIDQDWQLTMPGGLCIDRGGRLDVVLSAHRADPKAADGVWGHPSTEIVWLRSEDQGESYRLVWSTPADPSIPAWLPNLERPTAARPLITPSLIYTVGGRGKSNDDLLANEVRFVSPRE